MATRFELPADFAAALDRDPVARDRFALLPVEQQREWLEWIDRGRGRRGRAARIEEAVRRLRRPEGLAAEEEVAEPVPPPPQRGWWLWLLLLLLLVIAALVAWFFLTRGDGRTTVPNVVGMPSQAAAERLHEAHLKDLPTTGPSSRPQGIVFAQQPGAGARVDKNETVTISISSGAARRAVPDVTDLQEAQATQRLTAAGFAPQVKRVSSRRPKGIVFEQSPAAGVTAIKGATVIISVSTGVKTVTVPSVVGETQGDAVAQLTKLGLDPLLQDVPSRKPLGQIVAQRPRGGKKVGKGSTVVLEVSNGPGGTTTVRTTTARTTTARTTTVRTTSTTSTTVTTGG